MNKTRVLVVDDSAFMRHAISKHLSAHPAIDVIDTARDGVEAVQKVQELNPDVVTMDIEMPRLDGLGALSKLMEVHPLPVIMVSALTSEGSTATLRALELGAFDFVAKPSGSISLDIQTVTDSLIAKVLVAASSRARWRKPVVQANSLDAFRNERAVASANRPASGTTGITAKSALATSRPPRMIIAIGSSTGGPAALCTVMRQFPADLDAAIVIVQHMPPIFTKSLASRLNQLSAFEVKEAEEGDRLLIGSALVAPGDFHLVITKSGRVSLLQGPKMHGVRPAVDVTWESLAQNFGNKVTGIILTGMGSDGSEGAERIRQAGGRIVAQDEESCVVFGMPRSVIERGSADRVAPLTQIGSAAIDLALARR